MEMKEFLIGAIAAVALTLAVVLVMSAIAGLAIDPHGWR